MATYNQGVQSDSQNCHLLCGGAAQKPPFLPAVDAGVMRHVQQVLAFHQQCEFLTTF